jgi:hypothetical protein
MRTTVDIPDETYRAVKVMAAECGVTVRELVLEGLETVMRNKQTPHRSFELAVPANTQPGALEIDQETNDDLIGFP